MIYEYKLACIEAGLSDEQIKKIEQVFDTEYKAIQYDQTKREKYRVEILHIEGMVGPDGEIGSYDPEDYSTNIEEDFLHRCDLEHLQEVLSQLSDEDREFLIRDSEGYLKGSWIQITSMHELSEDAEKSLRLDSNDRRLFDVLQETRTVIMKVYAENEILTIE